MIYINYTKSQADISESNTNQCQCAQNIERTIIQSPRNEPPYPLPSMILDATRYTHEPRLGARLLIRFKKSQEIQRPSYCPKKTLTGRPAFWRVERKDRKAS